MPPRLAWADLARAAAIALVVLYHVGGAWIHSIVSDVGSTGLFIVGVNSMLLTVRMPLFFLVSGLLATRALERPWSGVVRGRVLDLLWPFAIWSVAFAPCWAFAYGQGWVDVPQALGWIAELSGAYWYLPALVVFFVVTRAAGRHRVLLLAGAVVLWLAAPTLSSVLMPLPGGLTWYRLATFFVWFVAGATLRPALERIAAAPLGVGLVVAGGWLALSLADRVSTWSATQLASVIGVAAAIMLCGAAARVPALARAGRFLGGRTLVIYLVHPVVLAVLVVVLPTFRGGDVVSLALILAATVALTVGPAYLRQLLPDWLFRFPFPVARRAAEHGPVSAGTRA